jgi:hypothetical protein
MELYSKVLPARFNLTAVRVHQPPDLPRRFRRRF